MPLGRPAENDEDQGMSGVEFSLSTGIWFQFHRLTRTGEHEQLLLCEREILILAFINEAKNYEFADRTTGDLLAALPIAAAAADVICTVWMARPRANRDAVALTNAMACYIFARYDVKMLGGTQAAPRITAMSNPAVEWGASAEPAIQSPSADVPKRVGQCLSKVEAPLRYEM